MSIYISNPIVIGTLVCLAVLSMFCLIVLTTKIIEVASTLSRVEWFVNTMEYKMKDESDHYNNDAGYHGGNGAAKNSDSDYAF
jgi:hypothetical protein